MPDTAAFTSSSPSFTADTRPDTSALRPLRRLRQLAEEIQGALRRGDMSLISQASNLLAPALAQWAESRKHVDVNEAAVLRLTAETQQALTACEAALTQAMSSVWERQGQARQHQRRLKQARSHKPAPARSPGKTLNISR